MIRTTTGHPARALRGLAVLLALWLTYRAPAVVADFAAAVAAGGAVLVAEKAAPATASVRMVPVQFATLGVPVRGNHAVVGGSHVATRRVALAVLPHLKPSLPRAAVPPVEPQQNDGGRIVEAAEPASVAPPVSPSADLATAAYARLAAGDRREASRLFDAALAAGADPRAETWRRERDRLMRRWSGSAYSIVRARGDIDLAATPVLGGGQSGAALAFALDPLAARPLALIARGSIAHDDAGSALAGFGIQWRPFAGVTVAAERLVRIGPASRSAWTLRAAGGAAATRGPIEASTYGEAGIVGAVPYAAAQARAGAIAHPRKWLEVGAGVGGWASIQSGGGRTVDRVDLGPGIVARAGWLGLALDYRLRVAGNAAPGSGPVLTLTSGF
ncbi:MAG: hypothetical protein ACRYG4_27855 [Janthinobacterium lividum]